MITTSVLDRITSYFIPHRETHQKAKLLSWQFLVVYILLFMLLRVGFDVAEIYKPGVLGVSSSITIGQIIDGTNQERVKNGLPVLNENKMLDQAAYQKARNMFAEDYWAHYSPSGKDPWGFITASGYKFSYAGENLARNFQTSDEVVNAWMNSPSHKENILSPKYQDIGIAVVDGVLKGEQTTLVVQMFGTPSQQLVTSLPSLGLPIVSAQGINNINATLGEVAPATNIVPAPSFMVDSSMITKDFGLSLIVFVSLLILIDFLVLKKRGVFRTSSHHFAHLSVLATLTTALLTVHTGQIL